MRPSLLGGCLVAVTSLVLAGCGGSGDGDLPAGDAVLTAAADQMATLQTVTIAITSDVDVGDLPVREVAGVVTRDGEAEGTAQVLLGQQLELRFVVVDDTFYYRLIGDWASMPLSQAAQFYDPSAILDPDRGVANLLRTASDARVVDRDGDRYRVRARFDPAALGVLVPGADEPVEGTVWIGVDRPLLQQAEFPLDDGTEAGTLRVELSGFDQPVTINAP